jgi:hypothetical protein
MSITLGCLVLAVVGAFWLGTQMLVRGLRDCALPDSAAKNLREATSSLSITLHRDPEPPFSASANDSLRLEYSRACGEATAVFDNRFEMTRVQVTILSSWSRFDDHLRRSSDIAGRIGKQRENTPESIGPTVTLEGLGPAGRSDLYCVRGSSARCGEWIFMQRSP